MPMWAQPRELVIEILPEEGSALPRARRSQLSTEELDSSLQPI